MAKVKCKGTTLKYGIAAAMVAVGQVETLDLSGFKTKTTDLTDLDTEDYEEKGGVGLAEPGTVKAGVFFDPNLAGHTGLLDDIPDPPADSLIEVAYNVTPAKAHTFDVAGIGVGIKVAKADYIKADLEFETTGTPEWS